MNRRNLLKSLLLAPLAPLAGKIAVAKDDEWLYVLESVVTTSGGVKLWRRRIRREDWRVHHLRHSRLGRVACDHLRSIHGNATIEYMS
jgi:hypothetical protein